MVKIGGVSVTKVAAPAPVHEETEDGYIRVAKSKQS